MWTAALAFLTAAAKACSGLFPFLKSRSDAKNTATMQANAGAKTDQQIKDQAAADVAEGDLDKLRRDIAQ